MKWNSCTKSSQIVHQQRGEKIDVLVKIEEQNIKPNNMDIALAQLKPRIQDSGETFRILSMANHGRNHLAEVTL